MESESKKPIERKPIEEIIPKADRDRIKNEYYLFDDLYMNLFMKGQKECAKEIISPIIKKDDLEIKEVITQKDLRGTGGKTIVLDILATDTEGQLYNIEIQQADCGADIRRARLNVSMLDSEYIKKGETFKDLPIIYVIFFTKNDVYKKGQAVYRGEFFFIREDKENPNYVHKDEIINIGIHIIYVNGQYKGSDAIGRLIADMWQTDPNKMQNKALAERAKFMRNKSEGGEDMRLLEKYQIKWLDEGRVEGIQEGIQEGRQEGAQQNKMDVAKAMLKDGLGFEMISKYTGLSCKELQELQDSRCA